MSQKRKKGIASADIVAKYFTAQFMFLFIMKHFRSLKFVLRLLRGYFRVNILKKEQLRFIEIFVTMACNAKCDFCSNGLYTPTNKKLDTQKYLKIIDECAQLDVPIICLIGGEPLLYKDLPELIKRINSHGIISMIATNGYLLNEEKVRDLAKCGLKFIVCSLLSTDSKEHNAVMKLDDSFERIFKAKEYCDKYGVQFGLASVLKHSDFANGNFERLMELSIKNKIWLNVNPLIPTGFATKQVNEILTSEDLLKLNEYAKKNLYVSTHLTNNYFGFGCPAGNAYLGVMASGEILPCFFFPVSLGNIMEITLKEAWEKALTSPLFKKRYKICFAGVNKKFISEYLTPIFKEGSLVPLPIEKHPRFDQRRCFLKDICED